MPNKRHAAVPTRLARGALVCGPDRGRRRGACGCAGFTLVEVLVALSITAIALVAGLNATQALTNNAARQGDVLLGQICAENALTAIRLAGRYDGLTVGDSQESCEQAGRVLTVHLSVRPTANPSFRRVDAQVDSGAQRVQLSTVVGRF